MKHPALKHPGRWIWLVLLVPIVAGLARLRLDAEIFDLLPSNLRVVEGLKLYQRYFTNARELIVTLQSPNPDRTEAAARAIATRLRTQTNLVSSVTWEAPWIEHPDQMAELVAYLWLNQPPRTFQRLARRLAPNHLGPALASARQQLATSLSPRDIARLSYDPLGLTALPGNTAGAAPSFGGGQSLFSSPDGTFRIVYIEARPQLSDYRDCERWLQSVKPIVAAAVAPGTPAPHSLNDSGNRPGPASLSVSYTGRPAFVAEVAAGMKHDIMVSVTGTAAVIALLFWLAHRRLIPMLWLLTLLALILGSTLALGGLIFGTINMMSMGFAAILLGLAVDYAVVHYQEALAHPNLSIPQIRHAIAPSIFWAAVTTITAFVVLNFGGLPGLGQLGTLVALGVALAATIMIFEYLPPLFPKRKEPAEAEPPEPVPMPSPAPIPAFRGRLVGLATAAVLLGSATLLLIAGAPGVDSTAMALRPRRSPAYAALDRIQKYLNEAREPLWLIISGQSVDEVAKRIDEVQPVLNDAVSNHIISSFTLPRALWPQPQFQAANRTLARQLSNESTVLKHIARTNGFAPRSIALTEGILATWGRASAGTGVFWPTNPASQWILNKVIARSPTNYFMLGLMNASTNAAALSGLNSKLPDHHVWLSGWELLGRAIFSRVQANLWKVVAPMIFLVLLSLWLAFRRPPEIALGLTVLALSGLCLLAAMRLAHWSWNLLDLMAIPLVLGTGVDYSLFMQLAMRRYHGNLATAHRSVGRALLLCGGTAIAAFTSLAWSSNAGMASLGRVCAVGIACNMLIAVFLLPVWWRKTAARALERNRS